jgi:hypothetical protein
LGCRRKRYDCSDGPADDCCGLNFLDDFYEYDFILCNFYLLDDLARDHEYSAGYWDLDNR